MSNDECTCVQLSHGITEMTGCPVHARETKRPPEDREKRQPGRDRQITSPRRNR